MRRSVRLNHHRFNAAISISEFFKFFVVKISLCIRKKGRILIREFETGFMDNYRVEPGVRNVH